MAKLQKKAKDNAISASFVFWPLGHGSGRLANALFWYMLKHIQSEDLATFEKNLRSKSMIYFLKQCKLTFQSIFYNV